MIRWINTFKQKIRDILLQRASPHQVAMGVAVGVFIGIFPTFGLGGFLLLGMAPFVRFNIPAAFIGGSLLNNPLTSPIWIYLSCRIVEIDIKSITSPEESFLLYVRHYSSLIGLYLMGNTIISTITSVITYGLTRWCFVLYRAYKNRKRKRAELSDQPAASTPAPK